MQLLTSLTNKALGFPDRKMQIRIRREAVRAVVSTGPKGIFLIHSSVYGYYKLPGGGIEQGESHLEALAREVKEELGILFENKGELGMIEEQQADTSFRQLSYCYYGIAGDKIVEPDWQSNEVAHGLETMIVPVDKAIELITDCLNKDDPERYQSIFIMNRDLLFIRKYAELSR